MRPTVTLQTEQSRDETRQFQLFAERRFMLIKIGFELIFDIPSPVNMLLALYTHPEQAHVLCRPERLIVDPDIPVQNYVDEFGNRVGRIFAPPGKLKLYYNNIAEDTGKPE